MVKRKKVIILGAAVTLVTSFFLTNNIGNNRGKSDEASQLVIFGPVDYSDDDGYELEDFNNSKDEEDSNDDGSWLENFITSHKTPFSKTIHKE